MPDTLLPASGYFTDALRTNGEAKQAQDDLLDYLVERFGNLDGVIDFGARSLINLGELAGVQSLNGGALSANRSLVINAGCRVATRTAPLLTNAFIYGKVDRFAAKADGTVGSGAVDQVVSNFLGSSGYVLHLRNVSLSGGAEALYARYRMEARDAVFYKDKSVVVHWKVFHDFAAPTDFTLTVFKANAADNFSALTQIAQSAAQSVAPGAAGQIELTVADMEDCSNGVEIVISAACGAIANKNLYLTELVMEPGDTKTPFIEPPLSLVEAACKRYARWLPYDLIFNSAGPSGTFILPMSFEIPFRAAPTVGALTGDPALSQTAINNSTNDFTNLRPDRAALRAVATAAGLYQVTGFRALATAEL
ncbi:MAG: hypothetical protein NXI21_01715 [Alphaproteobacteria bacterium]|nr:hypothetical protein [Alphaproteobacteria bacterium]